MINKTRFFVKRRKVEYDCIETHLVDENTGLVTFTGIGKTEEAADIDAFGLYQEFIEKKCEEKINKVIAVSMFKSLLVIFLVIVGSTLLVRTLNEEAIMSISSRNENLYSDEKFCRSEVESKNQINTTTNEE